MIGSAKTKCFFDPKLTRTANLQEAPEKKNWNLTRYHCAIGPCDFDSLDL
jgi:hypothetical protein